MDTLVISTHSFVDLITNSSSELFVCDSKKTVDAVKEILATLLNLHDKLQETSHKFDDVFGKIDVSEYEFNYYGVPKEVRDAYEYFHPDHFNHSRYMMWSYDDKNPEERALQEKEHQIGIDLNVWEKDLDKKNKKEYDRRWKLYREKEDELWTDWGARKLQTELNLFLEFFKQNGFSDKQIKIAQRVYDKIVADHIARKAGRYSGFYRQDLFKKHPALRKAHETIEHWESWGITAKKGSIFVESESDNTIPYELFETISSYLNAKRYHLG